MPPNHCPREAELSEEATEEPATLDALAVGAAEELAEVKAVVAANFTELEATGCTPEGKSCKNPSDCKAKCCPYNGQARYRCPSRQGTSKVTYWCCAFCPMPPNHCPRAAELDELAIEEYTGEDLGGAEDRAARISANQMLVAVNRERARNNRRALKLNNQLNSAAQRHSDDMARNNFMSHTGSDGSTIETRLRGAGYRGIAEENIGRYFPTAEQMVQAWMGSAHGHREAILCSNCKDFGYGYASGSGVRHTALFGT